MRVARCVARVVMRDARAQNGHKDVVDRLLKADGIEVRVCSMAPKHRRDA